MKHSLLLVCLLALALSWSCSKKEDQNNPGNNEPPGDTIVQDSVIVPLKVGNYWEYIDSAFSMNGLEYTDTSRLTITGSKIITYEGKAYEVFLWTWDLPYFEGSSNLVNNGTDGFYFYGGTTGDTDYVLTKSRYLKFPVQQGESWTYIMSVYNPTSNKFYLWNPSSVNCLSTNTEFLSKTGKISCYVFKETIISKEHFKNETWGIQGFKSSGDVTNINILYYDPGIGYVGAVTTTNGNTTFKKTLLSYHLN